MADDPNRVAVVTGGAQGIGLAIGERLANEQGCHVVVADLKEDPGRQAAERLDGSFVQLDVSDSASVRDAAEQVVRERGHVDVLVNNAGIAHEDPALELADDTWDRIIGIDLTGAFVASREFGRHMVERGSGAIVNISSISGVVGTHPEYHVAYDVAKAGVAQMARSLGVEWAQHGVRVNAVAPGRTNTAILEGVGESNPERMEEWMRQIPQRRLLEPDEIAAAVAFLASDAASAITGHTLLVDGGQTVS